jgi:hypothetical protein
VQPADRVARTADLVASLAAQCGEEGLRVAALVYELSLHWLRALMQYRQALGRTGSTNAVRSAAVDCLVDWLKDGASAMLSSVPPLIVVFAQPPDGLAPPLPRHATIAWLHGYRGGGNGRGTSGAPSSLMLSKIVSRLPHAFISRRLAAEADRECLRLWRLIVTQRAHEARTAAALGGPANANAMAPLHECAQELQRVADGVGC